jgi:hypothetical protein
MLGGGFLRQMNETIKSNRDLLGKTKKKPFDKHDKTTVEKAALVDKVFMSDRDRKIHLAEIIKRAKESKRRSWYILGISVIVTALIILLFSLTLGKELIEFLDN